jgi:hypothetical protein
MKYIVTWSNKAYYTCTVEANSEAEAYSKAFQVPVEQYEHSYDSGVYQHESTEAQLK